MESRKSLSSQLALQREETKRQEEIREKEGGTYSIGAYGQMQESIVGRPEATIFIIYQCSPDRYEQLNGRVREIVDAMATQGPSEENLAKSKEYLLKNYRATLQENASLSEAMKIWLDSRVDILTDYEKVLDGISAQECRKVFANMLSAGNHEEVIMVGEK